MPSRDGHIIDLIIVRMYETTAVNGLPLDALIEARAVELHRILIQLKQIFAN